MESIIQFRQMMADQKFFELQKLLEVQLTIQNEARYELLILYFETLKAQDKSLPANLILELAEHSSNLKDHDFALNLLEELKKDAHELYFVRITKIKIIAAEAKGQMELLYHHISLYLIRQFEKQLPVIPDWIEELIGKYFANDFSLQLKELSIALLQHDLATSEEFCRSLIISCIEKSSPKGVAAKLTMIGEVLRTVKNKAHLEIYQNFCFISARGISEKTDYKKIVEMIIFYNDFKFQTLVLNLLVQLELLGEAKEFAEVLRLSPDYDFVYFDKFFPHLKRLFVDIPIKTFATVPEEHFTPDLKLSGQMVEDIMTPPTETKEAEEDESKFFHLLKHQNYSIDQLCDLAVSFLQSDMPKVALKASQLIIDRALDDKAYLKGCYLKLTCLLSLKDYRAALDVCLEALGKAMTEADILSFLYGQAEVLIRLNQSKQAKKILSQIISIDAKYRSAKERLEKLNEI